MLRPCASSTKKSVSFFFSLLSLLLFCFDICFLLLLLFFLFFFKFSFHVWRRGLEHRLVDWLGWLSVVCAYVNELTTQLTHNYGDGLQKAGDSLNWFFNFYFFLNFYFNFILIRNYFHIILFVFIKSIYFILMDQRERERERKSETTRSRRHLDKKKRKKKTSSELF